MLHDPVAVRTKGKLERRRNNAQLQPISWFYQPYDGDFYIFGNQRREGRCGKCFMLGTSLARQPRDRWLQRYPVNQPRSRRGVHANLQTPITMKMPPRSVLFLENA